MAQQGIIRQLSKRALLEIDRRYRITRKQFKILINDTPSGERAAAIYRRDHLRPFLRKRKKFLTRVFLVRQYQLETRAAALRERKLAIRREREDLAKQDRIASQRTLVQKTKEKVLGE